MGLLVRQIGSLRRATSYMVAMAQRPASRETKTSSRVAQASPKAMVKVMKLAAESTAHSGHITSPPSARAITSPQLRGSSLSRSGRHALV